MKTPVSTVLEQIKLPFEKLHKFQEEDINELAVWESSGLYWDLGLGKTIASAIIGCYKIIEGSFDTVYVLCPEVLISQWVLTLEEMGVSVSAYRATPAKRKKINRDVDFLVMSYQIFQIDYDVLKDANAYFIVDEATLLCNTQNLIYKMLMGGEVKKTKKIPGKLIPEEITRTFKKINRGSCLLTATPINKPTDAYGLITITSPNIYRNYSQFLRVHVERYDYFDNPEVYVNLDMLSDNLLLGASRRLASDYLDLPPIIFKTVKYDLAPAHLKLYEKLMDERMIEEDGRILIDALNASALYNWAQKLIFNPEEGGYLKDPVGLEILDGLVDSVDKFIMFGNYRMTNGKLMERYKTGASYGAISSKKKREFIEAFKNGELKGLEAHPKSGGFGLDLPMCQQVFFPELPITPRDFSQCCGRVYRQGQKETVVVTTLVARGTIQETLFSRIQDKDTLMKEVVNTSRSLVEDLSANVVFTGKKTKAQILSELKGGYDG